MISGLIRTPFLISASLLWLVWGFGLSSTQAQTNHSKVYDSVTVYVFLMEDCPISQNYSTTLREMYEYYQVLADYRFVGYFPNKLSTDSTIAAFEKKYNFSFPLYKDEGQAMAKKLKATVAPEVVVVDERTQTILYRGRIDDLYFALKKKRPKAKSQDLFDALNYLYHNTEPPVKETTPVGCFITYN